MRYDKIRPALRITEATNAPSRKQTQLHEEKPTVAGTKKRVFRPWDAHVSQSTHYCRYTAKQTKPLRTVCDPMAAPAMWTPRSVSLAAAPLPCEHVWSDRAEDVYWHVSEDVWPKKSRRTPSPQEKLWKRPLRSALCPGRSSMKKTKPCGEEHADPRRHGHRDFGGMPSPPALHRRRHSKGGVAEWCRSGFESAGVGGVPTLAGIENGKNRQTNKITNGHNGKRSKRKRS